MLFSSKFHEPIRRGEVTLTVRRWLRPQARVAGRYRLHTGGAIEVSEVREVAETALTASLARRAGFASREALMADVPSRAGAGLYLVTFRYIGDLADPRKALASEGVLSEADHAELTRRLHRMDAGRSGVWTRETLRLIGQCEGVRAADLAARLGRETLPFKADVRRLKALGLTESLEVGYRLSARGRAYLERDSTVTRSSP
ncbi:MAG: hypothetical protein EPO65_13845 [Dehalococcoidia bacterium]|nr:MAG: hypothetical protein EPO65_13845 [Dehalococcoidia bacterium]